jgi:hypothetical protein
VVGVSYRDFSEHADMCEVCGGPELPDLIREGVTVRRGGVRLEIERHTHEPDKLPAIYAGACDPVGQALLYAWDVEARTEAHDQERTRVSQRMGTYLDAPDREARVEALAGMPGEDYRRLVAVADDRARENEIRALMLARRARLEPVFGVPSLPSADGPSGTYCLTCGEKLTPAQVKKGMTHHPGACWRNREDR